MLLCPNQHRSHATDYCEVCGVEMTPTAVDALPVEPTGVSRETCPVCHAEHEVGTGDFCEVCGYNLKTSGQSVAASSETMAASVPAPTSLLPRWQLTVAMVLNPQVGVPDGASLPVLDEEVHPLPDDVCLIGRRSVRRQIYPELSLDHDDGVSHRHARLTRLPDGNFSLEDLGSSNGTAVNGVEVKPGTPVTLKEGDRITLGRWTSLVLRRQEPPPDQGVSPPSLPLNP